MSKQIAVTLYKDGRVFSQGKMNPKELEALATKLSAYGITICKGKPKDSDRYWANTMERADKKHPRTQEIITYPCNEIALRAVCRMHEDMSTTRMSKGISQIGRRKDAEF